MDLTAILEMIMGIIGGIDIEGIIATITSLLGTILG